MKREIAASEGDQQTEPAGAGPELEDAEERNREWEMAKLQEEIRLAKKDKSKKKTEKEGAGEGAEKSSQQKMQSKQSAASLAKDHSTHKNQTASLSQTIIPSTNRKQRATEFNSINKSQQPVVGMVSSSMNSLK